MSTIPDSPPDTSIRTPTITSRISTPEPGNRTELTTSDKDINESNFRQESLAIREASPNVKPSSSNVPDQTPDAQNSTPKQHENNEKNNNDSSNPHTFEPFDWEGFESRYATAMASANETEAAIRQQFHAMADYFGVWAAAASQSDDDRALKRLKTREVYIQHAERSLGEKRKHYTQVVEAFKNALALLGGA